MSKNKIKLYRIDENSTTIEEKVYFLHNDPKAPDYNSSYYTQLSLLYPNSEEIFFNGLEYNSQIDALEQLHESDPYNDAAEMTTAYFFYNSESALKFLKKYLNNEITTHLSIVNQYTETLKKCSEPYFIYKDFYSNLTTETVEKFLYTIGQTEVIWKDANKNYGTSSGAIGNIKFSFTSDNAKDHITLIFDNHDVSKEIFDMLKEKYTNPYIFIPVSIAGWIYVYLPTEEYEW